MEIAKVETLTAQPGDVLVIYVKGECGVEMARYLEDSFKADLNIPVHVVSADSIRLQIVRVE